MSSNNNNLGMAEKIDDLTESLSRTTDVLTTADRMIDHYRNLNTEQECVIAKLKEDLKRSHDGKKGKNEVAGERNDDGQGDGVRRNSRMRARDESSDDLYEEEFIPKSIPQRKNTLNSPKVRFQESMSTTDYEIELLRSTMNEFKRKQESLEAGLQQTRHLQEEESNRLDSTLRRQISFDQPEDKSHEINNNLRRLQQQLEDDQHEYKQQQNEVHSITQEMKALRDVIQSTPKKEEATAEDIDKKIAAYKKKMGKQEDTIKLLKEQLESKKEEANTCESTVVQMQSLERMKSEQLKLLENKLEDEKVEKLNFLKEYDEIQKKLAEANKERAELLYHLSDLKNEARSTKLAYDETSNQLPHLKSLLEDGERKRGQLTDQLEHLGNQLQSSKNINLTVKSQVDDYSMKIKDLEFHNEKLSQELKDASSQCRETTGELETTKTMCAELEKKCEATESSKHNLKERALKTLREYRTKYRKYEKQIQDSVEQMKSKEIELSKSVSLSNEHEIVNLKLKKELQDLRCDLFAMQQKIVDNDDECKRLSCENSELKGALSKANEQTQMNYALQRDLQELKSKNERLTADVEEEKRKRRDVEILLKEDFERNVASKDGIVNIKKQLEESNSKLQAEKDTSVKELINLKEQSKILLEGREYKINELVKNNENLAKTLKTCEEKLKQLENDTNNKLKKHEDDFKNENEKVNNLTQKLRKVNEDNKKIRRQFQSMKGDYSEKLRSAQSANQSTNRESNVLMPRDTNIEPPKDEGMPKMFTILLQDSENLLSLLSYEEENVPTVKVIPHNILPDYRKAITEIREKYQACYSITKTLKGRFQQQKSLIKRAQEKIKSQMEQIRIISEARNDDTHHLEKIATLEVLHKSDLEKFNFIENLRKKELEKNEALEKSKKLDQDKILSLEKLRIQDEKLKVLQKDSLEKIALLEDSRKNDLVLIKEKERDILELKRRINELTKDLEGCTRALHKSIEVDNERKSVLKEIDLLKSEHTERQKIDENFFRCSEKIELLTEQLTEAKHSLNEIKQDSVDRNETTTNRLIETFGSVSPSRKRRLYFFDSPLFKSTKSDENDSNVGKPTRDTDNMKLFCEKLNTNDSLEDILLKDTQSKT